MIYQIFTPSFQDSNGDGIGDLAGILSRVEYLADLGVGAVWLTPIYPSPLLNTGYGIADFTGVGSCFGDLAIFDRLLAALHDRGRLIGLRRDRSELQAGRYRRLLSEGGVLAFARWQGRSGLVVVLNLSASDVTPALTCRGRIVRGTDLGREGERIEDQVSLSPHEGVIVAAEGG